MMAANVSEKWVGTNADALFSKITGCTCTMINDADAAGLAEMTFAQDAGSQNGRIKSSRKNKKTPRDFHLGEFFWRLV